jgi:alginate production protein
MDLVYHNYQQVYADTILRSARIDTPLTGENTDIGDEIDLVIGIEEWQQWEMKFIGSVFFAGDAYGPGAREKAYRADLQLKYIF